MKSIISLVLLTIFLYGCGEDSINNPQPPPPVSDTNRVFTMSDSLYFDSVHSNIGLLFYDANLQRDSISGSCKITFDVIVSNPGNLVITAILHHTHQPLALDTVSFHSPFVVSYTHIFTFTGYRNILSFFVPNVTGFVVIKNIRIYKN